MRGIIAQEWHSLSMAGHFRVDIDDIIHPEGHFIPDDTYEEERIEVNQYWERL